MHIKFVSKFDAESRPECQNISQQELEVEEIALEEVKKEEEEFISNYPVNIPVAKNEKIVEINALFSALWYDKEVKAFMEK